MAIDRELVSSMVSAALTEDIGSGDVTAALVPLDQQVSATLITRQAMTVCGLPWVNEVMVQQAPSVNDDWQVKEGDEVAAQSVLVHFSGPARELLSAERVVINFLQTLSGVATLTRQYVNRVAGLDVDILDTRKTVPGWRVAQKYAVHIGGGKNHRFGLYDAYLIKENHILSCGSIVRAIANARQQQPGLVVQVEVENLVELEEALAAKADKILLDNFELATLRAAVEMTQGRVYLEASGNVTLDTVEAIASTGINGISIGSLTKHIQAVDLSLRFDH